MSSRRSKRSRSTGADNGTTPGRKQARARRPGETSNPPTNFLTRQDIPTIVQLAVSEMNSIRQTAPTVSSMTGPSVTTGVSTTVTNIPIPSVNDVDTPGVTNNSPPGTRQAAVSDGTSHLPGTVVYHSGFKVVLPR